MSCRRPPWVTTVVAVSCALCAVWGADGSLRSRCSGLSREGESVCSSGGKDELACVWVAGAEECRRISDLTAGARTSAKVKGGWESYGGCCLDDSVRNSAYGGIPAQDEEDPKTARGARVIRDDHIVHIASPQVSPTYSKVPKAHRVETVDLGRDDGELKAEIFDPSGARVIRDDHIVHVPSPRVDLEVPKAHRVETVDLGRDNGELKAELVGEGSSSEEEDPVKCAWLNGSYARVRLAALDLVAGVKRAEKTARLSQGALERAQAVLAAAQASYDAAKSEAESAKGQYDEASREWNKYKGLEQHVGAQLQQHKCSVRARVSDLDMVPPEYEEHKVERKPFALMPSPSVHLGPSELRTGAVAREVQYVSTEPMVSGLRSQLVDWSKDGSSPDDVTEHHTHYEKVPDDRVWETPVLVKGREV